MGHIILALCFAFFWALLTIFFVYTLIAIVKGASYVPTTHARVARLLELADIKPGDRVLDLGSGDGRILFAAAKRGATCIGVEINPLLCLYSSVVAKLKGASSVSIQRRDFWGVNLSEIDVLTVYLVPIRLDQLKTKVLSEMKSGSRVVTAVYHFPDWAPEKSDGDICLYRVP